MSTGLPRKQKGAAAIESAAVFVIFLTVFQGAVIPLLTLRGIGQASNLPTSLSEQASLQR